MIDIGGGARTVALGLFGGLSLLGATCREAVEVGSELAVLAGGAWLEASCKNNPKSYCEDATAFSALLAQRLREQRAPATGLGTGDFETRSADALALDIALVREPEGGGAATAVSDGDTVRAGERLRLLVRSSKPLHVYAVRIDGGGVVEPLSASGSSIIAGGTTVSIPEAGWELTGYAGLEHVYVVASSVPDSQLEVALGRFEIRPRTAVASPARVTTATEVDSLATRAIGKTLSFGAESFVPERLVASPDAPLLITRWFQHESGS